MTVRQSQKGLTVIEVLVVILTIVVFAGLVLPMLSRSRKALGPQCSNNQRQIALAAIMYAEDSRPAFPNLDSSPGNDGPVALSLLTNYVGRGTNLFLCPFVAKQREKDRPWYQKKFVPELNRAFFQSNGNDYAYYDGLVSGSPTNAILADRFAWTNRYATNIGFLNHPGGRVNVAFADGHGENFRPDMLVGTNLAPVWSAIQDPLRRH